MNKSRIATRLLFLGIVVAAGTMIWRATAPVADAAGTVAPRQVLTKEESAFFAARTSKTVPWREVHLWFELQRHEPIAEAFWRATDRDYWLGQYGALLAQKEEHVALADYLRRYRSALAPAFDKGVNKELALQQLIQRVNDLDGGQQSDANELATIFADRAQPFDVRVLAFRQLMHGAPESTMAHSVPAMMATLLDPDSMSSDSIMLHESCAWIVHASGNESLRQYEETQICAEAPGWQHFVLAAAIRPSDEEAAWLLDLRSCASENVGRIIERTVDRIIATLERQEAFQQGERNPR